MTNLEYIRRNKRITITELSERSGISQSSISRFERGVQSIGNMRIETLLKLAKALDVEYTELIDDELKDSI